MEAEIEGKRTELENHAANAARGKEFEVKQMDHVYALRILLQKYPEWRGALRVNSNNVNLNEKFRRMLKEIVDEADKAADVDII